MSLIFNIYTSGLLPVSTKKGHKCLSGAAALACEKGPFSSPAQKAKTPSTATDRAPLLPTHSLPEQHLSHMQWRAGWGLAGGGGGWWRWWWRGAGDWPSRSRHSCLIRSPCHTAAAPRSRAVYVSTVIGLTNAHRSDKSHSSEVRAR